MGRLKSIQSRVVTLDTRTAINPVALAFDDPRRGSSTARGYGGDWKRRRLRILQRDQYLCHCAECRETGRLREAHEVDHVVAKEDGGSDDDSNLQAINRDCHVRKTAAERVARRSGGVVRI